MAEDLIRAALEEAQGFRPARPDGLLNPEAWPYRLTEAGVQKRQKIGDELQWRVFAPPLEVLADLRDGEGRGWSRLIGFMDRDGRRHEIPLAMAEIGAGRGAELLALLASGGYETPIQSAARSDLLNCIMQARPAARLRKVERLGWHGGAYVLPDQVIGAPQGERIAFQPPGDFEHAFRAAGSLEGWREEVAAPCAGNSRLVLSLCMGFAAPLLALLEEEGGGVHLRGGSSLGKTTALNVAASAYGGRGFVRSWRATSNALEGVALAHNDGLLCLDELGECDPRAAGEAAYMLGNGLGKGRASRSGSARAVARWRLLFLSTGELSLSDKIAEAGADKRARAGQELRFLDLPADAGAGLGIFERLPEGRAPGEFSKALKEAAQRHHGWAGPAFVARIAPRREEVREAAKAYKTDFTRQVLPDKASGQAGRAAQRFALIGAAGELAREAGLLPWLAGEALQAAEICFRAWLEERGGAGEAEAQAIVSRARSWLELHGASRFQKIGDRDANIFNRLGFYRDLFDGRREYLVSPETFKREILAGWDQRGALKALAEAGLLAPDAEGGYTAKTIRVAALGGAHRFYRLSLPEESDFTASQASQT